jgi:hypothetical protein
MADLELLQYCLGLEVNQDEAGITVSQKGYALKILMVMGMEECNLSHTTMENHLKLSMSSFAPPPFGPSEYRRIVGALRYLVNTRPDLAYPVGYVSRFMEKPTTEHLLAGKRVLRYIARMIDFGCRYVKRDGAGVLVGFNDTDLAGDLDTRKSTTGVLFLDGNLITWQSKKQRVVALSSCEVEYIAATMAVCPGIWLGRLLAEFRGEDEASPFALKIDNQSAMQLSRNLVFHNHRKNTDTKYHFIRQCVEEGRVRVEHIDTSHQLADLLTEVPWARSVR